MKRSTTTRATRHAQSSTQIWPLAGRRRSNNTSHRKAENQFRFQLVSILFILFFYVPIYETHLVRGSCGDDGNSRQGNFQAAFVLHHSVVVAMPRDTRGDLPDETKWKWKRNAKRGTRLGIGIGIARQAATQAQAQSAVRLYWLTTHGARCIPCKLCVVCAAGWLSMQIQFAKITKLLHNINCQPNN